MKIIKTRLEGAKGVWPDELLGVLWAYRMTVRTPTGETPIEETPFNLAYGNHSGARSLIHKVVRVGYYWPTVQVDAKAYVKACDKCQ